MKSLLRTSLLLPLALTWAIPTPQATAADHLEITCSLLSASGDPPMIVLWVEKTDGTFLHTISMLSKDHKYYKDILKWWAAREGKESKEDLDASVGATIKWGQERTLNVPLPFAGADILDGNYVIRIEQRKDKGGHYSKDRIPLTAGFTTAEKDKVGYIKHISVTLKH